MNASLKTLITALAMLTFTSLPALANCDDPKTQTEMNICAAEEFKLADKELNETYSRVSKGLEPNHKDALLKAQRAWIKYKDLACEAYSLQAEGGSMQPMLHNMCLTRLTGERSQFLAEQFEER